MISHEISANFKEINKNIEKLDGEMLETLIEHPFLIKSEASKEENSEELKSLTVVKKKLAYPIKKNKFGFYCLVNFSAEGEKLKEIDNYLKMNNNILRHIIVQDDPMTKEELARLHKLFARKKAEQEKEEKLKESAKEAPKGKKEEIKAPADEEVKAKKIIIEKKEKIKEEVEDKKEKIKTSKKKEIKTKKTIIEKKEKIKEEVEEIKEPKKEKEGTKKESAKKKKIKLEDLENKLDEILEDTML